jgi:N-acetylmuramoyl-L-alanine amidase
VVVVMSEPTVYEVGQLPAEPGKGPRLFVDVEGASYEGDPQFEVGGLVSHVRVGRQDGGTRIVLDLRERVYQHIFFLPEPFRLVIDVSKSPPRGAPSPLHGARAVQRIVLDPGHGGHDPGAVGHMGLQEKDVALDVALRAAPLIARELGINTLLTRDTDQFVPLDERVAKANAFSADLFISIHCNASESAQTQGVMTFVLDESRDALAQQVAARENAASAAAGKQLATAMSQVMGADSLQRSLHFAQLLQRASLSSLSGDYPDFRDGGVRRAGFYVLAGAQMPAVLFEASFISNAEEERRLDSAGYRQKLADALVNAVRAYQAGL